MDAMTRKATGKAAAMKLEQQIADVAFDFDDARAFTRADVAAHRGLLVDLAQEYQRAVGMQVDTAKTTTAEVVGVLNEALARYRAARRQAARDWKRSEKAED